MNRRSFLYTSLAAGAAVMTQGLWRGNQALADGEGDAFTLPALPYGYDALEPIIDKMTMEIHHGKHHAGYTAKLNAALKGVEKLKGWSIDKILWDKAGKVPSELRQNVINNGGGFANHDLFWKVLGPKDKVKKAPTGALKAAIDGTFESFEKLAATINDNGGGRFGSGWTWLVKDKDGKLLAYSTANQDSPYLQKHTPLFGIDVWEHAYYLKYQNRRAEYLTNIWQIVNWEEVERRYAEGMAPIEVKAEKPEAKKAEEKKVEEKKPEEKKVEKNVEKKVEAKQAVAKTADTAKGEAEKVGVNAGGEPGSGQ